MGIRNIAVTITGDGSSLSRALLRGGQEVDTFGRKVETTNVRAALSWKTAGLASVAAVGAVSVALTASAVAAAQFETRMRNVNSIVHANDADFASMSRSVLDLSTTLPQSANTLAEGLYDIASSGFAGSEGLLVLEKSAKAASAGLTTTQNSAQAITAVLNAYGLSAASAGDVSDTLFQTVNLGVVSFEELSGVIGDVVGTAAAAKVDIAQVGAAIATMTLSGISGAEAGTSLNRVLQSLIQPSDALSSLYHQLGYESGAAALQNKGLAGVMEDIRKSTGGNITTLLALFPEIRAARGALALMSDEGKTYQRVSKGIQDENERLGATQRALDEQLKAAGAQWQLFVNGARARAIQLGTQVLPVFVSFLAIARETGTTLESALSQGLTAVTPLLQALYATGVNVAKVLEALAEAVGPVAAALAEIAATTVVGLLTVLAKTLASLTGFMADHKTVVLALAVAYGATLLPSLLAVRVAFNRLVLTPIILAMNALIGAAAGGAVSMRALAASLFTAQAAATAGFAVIAFGLFRAIQGFKDARQAADKLFETKTQDFNPLNTGKAVQDINDLNAVVQSNNAKLASYGGTLGRFRAGWNQTFGDQSVGKAAANAQAAADMIEKLGDETINASKNLTELATATGLSREQLAKLVVDQQIDLTTPYEKSAAARKQVLEYLQDLAKQSGTTSQALMKNAGMDIEAMEHLSQAIADMQKKAGDAFANAVDVLGTWKPNQGVEEVVAATDRVKNAEQSLADLRATQADKKKLDHSDSVALARAEDAVSDARAAKEKALQTQREGTLSATYSRMISMGRQFSRDLQTATERGLDPGAVAKLVEEGPEQAGPILQQLVNDHSGKLIKMVNDSERALASINQRVVEQARLTALAINSTSDRLSRDLAKAMRISGETLNEGVRGTVESVAKKLGLPSAEVKRIAEEYGISLVTAAQAGVNSKSLTLPKPIAPTSAQRNDPDFRRAGGGLISGPGTDTSDSLLVRLSNGEYVQRAAAVRFYGADFMERLNNLQLPRFATGGLVGAERMAAAASSSRMTVQSMTGDDVARVATALASMSPRVTTHQNHFERVDNYEDVMRRAQNAERLAALTGLS